MRSFPGVPRVPERYAKAKPLAEIDRTCGDPEVLSDAQTAIIKRKSALPSLIESKAAMIVMKR